MYFHEYFNIEPGFLTEKLVINKNNFYHFMDKFSRQHIHFFLFFSQKIGFDIYLNEMSKPIFWEK